jgi:hypothetical protein
MKLFFQSEKGNQLTAFFSILGVPSTTIKFGNRNITVGLGLRDVRVKGYRHKGCLGLQDFRVKGFRVKGF